MSIPSRYCKELQPTVEDQEYSSDLFKIKPRSNPESSRCREVTINGIAKVVIPIILVLKDLGQASPGSTSQTVPRLIHNPVEFCGTVW